MKTLEQQRNDLIAFRAKLKAQHKRTGLIDYQIRDLTHRLLRKELRGKKRKAA